MLATVNQEIKNAKRLDIIENYEFNEILDFEEIVAYYDAALKIISHEDEMFLEKNNIYNYALSETMQQLKDKLELFKKLALKFNDKPRILIADQIKAEALKFKLNGILNSAAVTLMYKGNFNQAFHFLDFNLKLNDDKLSESYIGKIEEINEFIFKYNVAIDLIKLESYGDAVKILEDYFLKGYRTEKGDILLTLLYHNKKNYVKARKVLNSISDLCKSSMFYYEIYSELNRANKFKLVKYAGIAAIILIVAATVYEYSSYQQRVASNEAVSMKQEAKNTSVINNSVDKNVKQVNSNSNSTSKVKNIKDYSETLKQLGVFLSNNDLKSFDKLNENIDYEQLGDNYRKKYDEILKRYKIASQLYYYNKGREYYKVNDFENSIKSFETAYGYKNGEYLDEHVVFMLGQSLQKKGDFKAIDYYREYINTYKNGSYIEETLYNMSLLYFSNNKIKEAKDYAKRLSTNYEDSMYNNQKIRAILES